MQQIFLFHKYRDALCCLGLGADAGRTRRPSVLSCLGIPSWDPVCTKILNCSLLWSQVSAPRRSVTARVASKPAETSSKTGSKNMPLEAQDVTPEEAKAIYK